MNTKGIKFLAVLAVLAMAFAACAVVYSETSADVAPTYKKSVSPLDDLSAPVADASVKIGNLVFTPCLQPTASLVGSNNSYKVYGSIGLTATTKGTDIWNGAYTGFDTTLSFALTSTVDAADGYYYYVYQTNDALVGDEKAKVSGPLLASKADTASGNGSNPSFEVSVPSTEDAVVTLKLLKTTLTSMSESAAKDATMSTAGVLDIVNYTLTFDNGKTTINDSNAVGLGFFAKKTEADVEGATYYTTLDQALNSINAVLSKDTTITVLADHTGTIYGKAGVGSISDAKTLTVDLNGKVYTVAPMTGIGTGGKDTKALYFTSSSKVEIKNGSILANSANKDVSALIKSFAPTLTLTSVKIDATDINYSSDNQQFITTGTGIKGGAALYLSNGNAVMDDKTQIIGSKKASAIVVYGFCGAGQLAYTATQATINGAKVVGDVVLSTETYGSFTGTLSTATLEVNSGSIDGSLIVPTADHIIRNESTKNDAAKTITINGMTVDSDKKLTIGANTTVTVSKTTTGILGLLTNNGTIEVEGTLIVKNNDAGVVGTNGIAGTGTVSVKSTGTLYAGLNSPAGNLLIKNTVKAVNGATIIAGESGANKLVGAGGAIVLDTNSTFQSVNNSALNGSDYTIIGTATITLPYATFLKGTDTVTFGTDDNKNKAATFTIGNAMTVPKGAVLNVMEGASIVTNNDITVKGLVKLAESSQYTTKFVPEDTGKVEIVGDDGSSEKEVKPVTPTGTTIDNSTFESGVDVIMTEKAGLTEVTVPSGKTVIIEANPATNAEMDISADNSELTINTGNTLATYTVNAGGDNKIYLEGVTGSLTFTKGSIEIDISKWTGGEIKLDDDAVVKIFGTASASADLKITMKNSGKTATLIIEEDKEVAITFTGEKSFIIGEGIDFTIDGKLTATKLTTNDNVTVGSKATLNATAYAANGATKTVDVYGILKGAVTAEAKVIANGTSDINEATVTYGKLSGKSSNGGTWTYAGGELKLTDYKGNYNFTQLKTNDYGGIVTIVLEGENKVTYSKEVAGATTLFTKQTKGDITVRTVQGTGSLEVVMNLSKTKGTNLDKAIVVFDAVKFALDSADLKITVSGSKSDWTAEQIRGMNITAINATSEAVDGFKIDDSSLIIDVMSSYSVIDPADGSDDGTAVGIKSAAPVVITNNTLSEISIKTAEVGIEITGNKSITVSGATFTLDAKRVALTNGSGAITFNNSLVDVQGKNAIFTTGSVSFTGVILGSKINAEDYALAASAAGVKVDDEVKIRSSAISFEGAVNVTALTISSGSIVMAEELVTNGKLDILQASELAVNDITLKGVITSENNGTITINKEGVINDDAKLTNKAVLINKGTLGIYGELENVTPGLFTNDGTFNVYKQKLHFVNDTNDKFTIGGDVRTDDTKAKLKSIDISAAVPNGDGSAAVIATLDFDMKTEFTVKDAALFIGTFAPNQDDKGYTLTLTNGSATVTVTYVDDNTSGKTKTIGDLYTVTAQGVLVDENDETKVLYLEPNKYDKTITPTDTFVSGDLFTPGTAKLTLTSGTMVNSGTATLFASDEAFLGENAAYEGALLTEIPAVTLNGTFTGNLGSMGTGLVTVNNTFIGNIIAKGGVTLSAEKSMAGNIVAGGNVAINGALEGDVEILLKAPLTAKFSVSGEMEGDFIYGSEYKAEKDDVIDTVEFHKVAISADMVQTSGTKTFEINLVGGTNATTTASGKPGYLTLGTLEAPEVGNNVQLTLNEGFLKVPASVTIPERFELVIEKDTTIEVSLGATLDVKKAALKVSKDAIAHFETGSVGTTYGLVGCVMSFEIESGAYTIYSDVAYALTACDEGAVLTVTTSADIADNVSVKKGVNVIIDDKVTLDFKTFGLEMDEGAKITLVGTAKVVFGQTGEDKTDDTAWEFFTISGTFVFDEGKNKIVFDDVRFDAAGAEVAGKAATASADSALSVKLNYSEGEATIAAGNATGSVVLKNVNYPLAKGADDSLFSGSFAIAADAVYEGTITDMAGDATYVDSVYTITKKPTVVDVSGTFKATSGITVNGVYGGAGTIVLSDNKSITIAVGKFLDDEETQLIAPSFTGTVRDTNLLGDEYKFVFVSALPAGGADVPAGEQFVIKSVKDSSSQYIALNGTIYLGAIVVDDTATLDTVTVMKNAAITADTVEILKDSIVEGKVIAKELKEKSEEYPKLGKLDYDATYDVDGYTVYTVFANIDPELVSEVTLTKSKVLNGAAQSIDFSGMDVNISMAEGVTITLDNGAILTIGTPATVLGDEGSSISGIIIIKGVTSYLVAYSDVDLDDAEIYSVYDKNDASKCKDAVYSILDIEDIPYVALFANEATTVKLADADKKIVPEVEGYNFTKWCNYDDDKDSKIGETNAYADFKAVTVFVTVKFVTGIAYYCNGIEFAVYDTPVKVEYNSVFTAKISDTSKYQGTPLVNGKNSLVITDDVEIVGSGVTPIPEPPAPEPVVGDSGISLTDILLIVLVILIAIMVVILVLRLNRS